VAEDRPTGGREDDVDPRDAALLAALDRGELVYEPTTREEEDRLIAELDRAAADTPDDVDDMLVVGTLRLTVRTRRQLEAYAESIGVKPTVLMRQWIEESLARATGEPVDPIIDLERTVARVRQAWQQLGPPRQHAA
jgi:hypothetical protein